MITEIELHDSELLHVDVEAGTLLIDAYVHRTGADVRREGGYQQTLFQFENLRIESEKGELSGDIYDWNIFAASLTHNDLIPLPCEIAGPVELKITLTDDGREIRVLGHRLTVQEAGPYRFVEFWRD
jgi:hypothetical protein